MVDSHLIQDFSNPFSELTQGYYVACSIKTYDSVAHINILKFFYSPPRDRTNALRMQVEHLPTELNHLQKRKETNKKIKWSIFSNFYKVRTYLSLKYNVLPIHFYHQYYTNSIWFTILLYLKSGMIGIWLKKVDRIIFQHE